MFDVEINEVLNLAGVQLNEVVKRINVELTNTRLVTNPRELDMIIQNAKGDTRVLYDKEKNWFLIDNAEISIHTNLINDALLDGVYPPFEWNGHMIDGTGGDGMDDDGGVLYNINPDRFVLFVTSKDKDALQDTYSSDTYTNCYHYPNYYVIDRVENFMDTPLYTYLGTPKEITHWDGSKIVKHWYSPDYNESDTLNENTTSPESKLTLVPTDTDFWINGKNFLDEGSEIYYIKFDGVKVGKIALTLTSTGVAIDGLMIDSKFRHQGYGSKVVEYIRNKYKKVYVRSILSAKGFWNKFGHTSIQNRDTGTFDGYLK